MEREIEVEDPQLPSSKSYSRQTMARFNTDDCKVILMAMHYAKHHGVFENEGISTVHQASDIIRRLKYRIGKEAEKNENGAGNQGDD